MSDEWKEYDHPVWGKGGIEEKVHDLGLSITFPKKIWRKGELSIIPPCGATMDLWELFDGRDTYRFDSFEEAKNFKHD